LSSRVKDLIQVQSVTERLMNVGLSKRIIKITEKTSGCSQSYFITNDRKWTPAGMCVEYESYYEIARFSWYMRIDKESLKITGNQCDVNIFEELSQYSAEITEASKSQMIQAVKPKLYRIKPNGKLHEDVELEIEHYRYLYECGVDEGEISEDDALCLRERTETLFGILQRALGRGVTGKDIAYLKEVSASRAIRKDTRLRS